MRITSRELRSLIREEIQANIDEMALGTTSFYPDHKGDEELGIKPAHQFSRDKKVGSALPNNQKYMARAKMQLEKFPLNVNVVWLEGIVHAESRSVYDLNSRPGKIFQKLLLDQTGRVHSPADFGILINADNNEDMRGQDKINYSIHNAFHQLFDGGPFNKDYAVPLQKLAFEYISKVDPDIAESDTFQDAYNALQSDYEQFVDYDNILGDDYAPDFKKIFSKIFKGRTIRLGLATTIREICNEALNFSLMHQSNAIKPSLDPETQLIMSQMSQIFDSVPPLAISLRGKILFSAL
jgi:hypothetical protein